MGDTVQCTGCPNTTRRLANSERMRTQSWRLTSPKPHAAERAVLTSLRRRRAAPPQRSEMRTQPIAECERPTCHLEQPTLRFQAFYDSR
jgi:hypothetical protein